MNYIGTIKKDWETRERPTSVGFIHRWHVIKNVGFWQFLAMIRYIGWVLLVCMAWSIDLISAEHIEKTQYANEFESTPGRERNSTLTVQRYWFSISSSAAESTPDMQIHITHVCAYLFCFFLHLNGNVFGLRSRVPWLALFLVFRDTFNDGRFDLRRLAWRRWRRFGFYPDCIAAAAFSSRFQLVVMPALVTVFPRHRHRRLPTRGAFLINHNYDLKVVARAAASSSWAWLMKRSFRRPLFQSI